MHIGTCHIAEDQRVVILTGLVTNDPRIAADQGSEPVLSNIGGPEGEPKEESLNCNDVNCIDPVDTIHIRRDQLATSEWSSQMEKMPLHGDHIHGGDARSAWSQRPFAGHHGVV